MLELQLNTDSKIEELVNFSQSFPWVPAHPSSLVRRFLTDLISSPRLICDFHDNNGRVAVAVYLDKVKCRDNYGCLEIIGINPDVDKFAVLSRIFEWAHQLSIGHRGFQLNIKVDLDTDVKKFSDLKLQHKFDCYEMLNEYTEKFSDSTCLQIRDAEIWDKERVYDVLCTSFAENPETGIPDPIVWKADFLKLPDSKIFVYEKENVIVGFAKLVLHKDRSESEVRTIGVLPDYRGHTIGRQLLHHCLRKSIQFGFQKSRLSVAVKNEKALSLYTRSDFHVTEHVRCYRRDFTNA